MIISGEQETDFQILFDKNQRGEKYDNSLSARIKHLYTEEGLIDAKCSLRPRKGRIILTPGKVTEATFAIPNGINYEHHISGFKLSSKGIIEEFSQPNSIYIIKTDFLEKFMKNSGVLDLKSLIGLDTILMFMGENKLTKDFQKSQNKIYNGLGDLTLFGFLPYKNYPEILNRITQKL